MEPAYNQTGNWGAPMNAITVNGEVIYLVDGVDHTGDQKAFGMPKTQLAALWERSGNVALAQFHGIVIPGLVLVEHIFQGLKRPLCDDEDMEADQAKLVFTWRPAFDYWWNHANRFEPELEMREAPDGRVFAVIVTPNIKSAEKYPSVHYWIERWFWVRRSNTNPKAPIDWENRYERTLK